jgi:potassium-transporting ATPase KdpC subunit
MIRELRDAVRFTFTTMLLFGGLYPVVVWGIGRMAFGDQAAGSLIYRTDGSIAGSRLIAQAFSGPRYFHPRPSAVDYDAASAGGSNYGPSNPDHLAAVREQAAAIAAREGVAATQVPSEMATASGSGLDPHIPPAAAELQINRVAAARGVAPDRIRAIVLTHTEPPAFGILGRARVNVLGLNLALDDSLRER